MVLTAVVAAAAVLLGTLSSAAGASGAAAQGPTPVQQSPAPGPGAAGAGAGAGATAEQLLAERHAPTVVVRRQDRECDRRTEGLRPVPVDLVLGRDDVVLRDRNGEIVARAPTAADLAGKGADFWLDLPGNALKPGCDYDHWFRRIGADAPTTAYAHIRVEPDEPGRLALQYWFYWVFNDWNDEHESDWEMIQLVFEADSAAEALTQEPVEAGYSQHEGAQRADWDGGHLRRDDNSPVAHAGAGSHSNHYKDALFFGHSGAEGFGCDNTTAPTRAERTQVILLPTRPGPGEEHLAWLTYRGHWGERQRGPNNGPTGPNMKTQWLAPTTWAEDSWRDGAVTVPSHDTFNSGTTSFACGTMEVLSSLYITYVQTPWLVLGGMVALVVGAVVLARRTRWSPAPALPVDHRRRAGELFRSSARLYRRHPTLFLGIGALAVPMGLLFSFLQFLIFELTGLGVLVDVASGDVMVGLFGALLAGALGTTVAAAFVYAGCAWAAQRLDSGEPPALTDVYRVLWARKWTVLGIVLWLTVVAGLLAATVIGIPFAVVYLVRRLPALVACMVEGLPAGAAIRRSRELVKGRSLRAGVFIVTLNLFTTAVGPLVALVVLFAWSPSLTAVNLIGGVLYTLAMPYAGLGFALLFYDLRQRRTAADRAAADEPAGPPPEAPVPAEV